MRSYISAVILLSRAAPALARNTERPSVLLGSATVVALPGGRPQGGPLDPQELVGRLTRVVVERAAALQAAAAVAAPRVSSTTEKASVPLSRVARQDKPEPRRLPFWAHLAIGAAIGLIGALLFMALRG